MIGSIFLFSWDLTIFVYSFSCYILAKAFAGAVCYIGVKRAFAITFNEVL
jgi:hypothetical protein